MAHHEYGTLSNRAVGKLRFEKDTVFWDRELTGLRGEGLSHREQGVYRPGPGP